MPRKYSIKNNASLPLLCAAKMGTALLHHALPTSETMSQNKPFLPLKQASKQTNKVSLPEGGTRYS